MKVLYAVSEAAPFCKTGGLGVSAGSLPYALSEGGVEEVAAVLPLYQSIKSKYADQLEFVCSEYINLSWRSLYCGLLKMNIDGVTWYFIDNEYYFDREDLYSYHDDGERFGFFSKAVVSMLKNMAFKPDIVHCNEWQTALIPVYLRVESQNDSWYANIRTVLTIFDIEYQGQCGMDTLGDLFGLKDTVVDDGTMIMDNCVNMLKGGIICANAVTAISPTYANELKLEYFAYGMESVIQKNFHKVYGIKNGLDAVKYNPETDNYLAANYSVKNVEKRVKNKVHLQQVMGLKQEKDIPVIGMVARMNSKEGFDILCDAFSDIMNLGVQFAITGQGETRYENFFSWAAEQYPGRVAYKHGTADETSAAIYAGSDFYLMPARTQAGGRRQMMAMRYGAVPIVREVGGLKDTVIPFDAAKDTGTGFEFTAYTPGDLYFSILNAVDVYKNKPVSFKRLQKRAMSQDFNWSTTAAQYKKLYESVL